MTRKEEIRNASVAYNEKAGKLLVIGGDSILSEEEYLEFNKNPSFIAGEEWADKTMLDKVDELETQYSSFWTIFKIWLKAILFY